MALAFLRLTQNLHKFNPRSENISELLKQLTFKNSV